MPGKTSVTFEDYGSTPERSTFQFYHVQLTAANFDTTAGAAGLIDDLLTATYALVLGSAYKRVINAEETLLGSAAASDPAAQRENKWLCTYQDDVSGRKYQVEIPCADLDQLSADGKTLDLTAGTGLAFKTAFDAVVYSPYANASTLLEVRFVGRNL